MQSRPSFLSCLSAVILLMHLFADSSRAVTLGFKNDFEDATTQGWANGSSAPDPGNINTGGPLGASDNFLRVVSDNSGSGGKLTTFNNSASWLGNYLLAGVTSLEMDFKNFGTSALTMRIAFKSGTGGSATPGYATTIGVVVPADGEWHHVSFLISASAMTGINSPAAFNTFMTNPGQLRILHSANPSITGDNITANLGVDNIVAVPETASGMLLVCAGGILLRRRRAAARRA